jgi:tRNA-specific 2-thiouridylase
MTKPTDQAAIVAALSGGVDSAVAAARLVDQGFAVIGMMLQLQTRQSGHVIPSPDAIERARAVSRHLGIPFRLVDAQETFQREIIDYFVTAYASGRTPNPCVRCNRFVRFDVLMEQAQTLRADAMATGHYARIRESDDEYQLLRGCDETKDQSYFLHALTQEQLARTVFPLGRLTKKEVRSIASQQGLPVAEQAESQDVCFLVEGDYRRFLEERAPDIMEPGPICDTTGRVLGEHHGLAAYTIGQRKGLNVSASERLYVLAIEPERNAIVVGTADQLGRDRCLVERMHYVTNRIPDQTFRAEAQIRYQASPAAVTVMPGAGGRIAEVRFDRPQRDITPGQFLVLYDGDVVLGGGIICNPQNSVL